MLTPSTPTSAVAAARSAGAAGRWSEVCALVTADARADHVASELAVLVGEALLRTGRPAAAEHWLRDALPSLRRADDRAALRRATNLRGAALFATGATADAELSFGQALELADQDDDPLLLARACNNLGAIANVRGAYAGAIAHYSRAIPVYERVGSLAGLAETHHNLAITYRDMGSLAEAMDYERRALDYATRAGSQRLAALAWMGRAELHLRGGDSLLAAAGAARAAAAFATLGDGPWQADAARLVGLCELRAGRLEAARRALEQSVALALRHGDTLIEAQAREARAELARALGDHAAAAADAGAAAELFTRAGAERDAARVMARADGRG